MHPCYGLRGVCKRLPWILKPAWEGPGPCSLPSTWHLLGKKGPNSFSGLTALGSSILGNPHGYLEGGHGLTSGDSDTLTPGTGGRGLLSIYP